MQIESRFLKIDPTIVQNEAAPIVLSGRAVVYNSRSEDLGGFREYIAPGAFSESLKNADIVATIDHDFNRIIGRNTSGTLRLSDNNDALDTDIDLPDTSYARDLLEMVRRGDVSGMSFQMYGIRDDWAAVDGIPTRTIRSAKIREVSVVTFPAYPETSIALRSLNVWLESQEVSSFDLEIARYRLKLAETFYK